MQELYGFMAQANATLDESLEEEAPALGSAHGGSQPPSVKATPRSLPSAEARELAWGATNAFWVPLRKARHAHALS